jgi:hypothetical protein
MTISIESCQHLKTATIVDVTLIFRKETKLPIIDRQTELIFPEAAGFRVQWGSNQRTVQKTLGKSRVSKVELDNC